MTYAEFFNEIRNKFIGSDVSDINEHLAYQFNIEDEEAGGIFYVEVKEGFYCGSGCADADCRR